MKNTSERKVLHIDRVNPSPLWNYKQEDDGVLLLSLYKGGQAFDVTGQTITLGVRNSKGQLIEHNTGVTINKSNVDIVLNNSIFAVKGKLECDLILKDNQGQMSTATFYLIVGQKVLGEDNLTSSNVLPAIDKLVKEMNTELDTFKVKGDVRIDEITKDYCTLQKVIIDENVSANLQNQINNTNSQLETMENIQSSIIVYLEKYRHLAVNADWTNAINTAISELPPLNIVQLYKKMEIGGGGKIVFPLVENIKISGQIKIPAYTESDLNKSIIMCTTSNSCFTIKDTVGLYDNNSIGLYNGSINGNNIATNGLNFYRLTKSYFKNLIVYKCVGDGIKIDQAQWCDFHSVYSFVNSGYGVSLDGVNDLKAPCANNSFVRCMFEGNTLGGAFLGVAIKNSFTNCTFQFSANGYGVHCKGTKNISNDFISSHFEGNKIHAYMQSDNVSGGTLNPRNTTFISPYFVIATGVERWVINEGDNTVIENYSCQNNISELYEKNGTKAPIEQSKTSGFIKVTGSLPLSINSMYCYSDGVEVTQNDTYNSRFLICEQRYDGWNFAGTFKFDGAGGKNMLKINGYYLWVDAQGKLRIRNRRAESVDDLLGTIVGTQS